MNPNMNLLCFIMSRNIIGYDNFLEGFVSTTWGEYIQTYYEDKDSRRTGHSWTKRMIKYLLEFLFDIWEGRNKQLHETKRIEDMEGTTLFLFSGSGIHNYCYCHERHEALWFQCMATCLADPLT